MASVEPIFNKAYHQIIVQKDLIDMLSSGHKAHLYGLLMQVKQGDNTKPQPSASNLEETQKWKAWTALKGKNKEEAMKGYIEYARNVLPTIVASSIC